MSNSMNYYELLGVKRTASNDELKKAYKQLVKKYHPDLYTGDKSFAEQKTKEINVAYDTLSDATKRAEYDAEVFPAPAVYSYTPPKYDTAPNDYYRRQYEEKIRNSYQREYNYNDYVAAYRAARRNAAAKSASKYSSNNYSEELYKKFSAMKYTTKVFVVLMIVLIYAILMIENLVNTDYARYFHTESPKTTTTRTNTTLRTDFYDKYYDDKSKTEFDINDYFSEDALHKLYDEKYYKKFDSYEDFREMFSIHVRDNFVGN